MQNIGEEIVGDYLKHCKKCDFISYNVSTPDIQGEIDVIGINANKHEIYICEVAVHLETGLMYVNTKENQPDNVRRLTSKFIKDIEYAKKYFATYSINAMLWSPIVKNSREGAKHNQSRDILQIQRDILRMFEVEIELVVNEQYMKALEELREVARSTTEELKSPVMRLFQIDEKLKRHISRIQKRKNAA